MENKELAMNGAGVAELGFPMWPQFDPRTKADMAEVMDSGLVSYWTGKQGMEFEEKFRQWSGATMAISCSCVIMIIVVPSAFSLSKISII